MVSTSSIIAICIVLAISLLVPIGSLIFMIKKYKGERTAAAWGIGALGFFVMQVIIRMPILSLLQLSSSYVEFAKNNYLLYCIILGTSAGLFEVVARIVGILIIRKKIGLNMHNGIAAGLGHGGIECVVLISSTYISNLSMAVMINSGMFDNVIQQYASDEATMQSLLAVKDTLCGASPYLFYLAGYERILTMCLHVALTAVVCYFVLKKKTLVGVIIAFAAHSAADSISGILSGLSSGYLGVTCSQTVTYILIYVFLTAVAAASVIVTVSLCKSMKQSAQRGEGIT